MSELTTCNYCNYKAMQREAKARGERIILRHTGDGWISARYSDEPMPSAFFRALSGSCVC